MHPFIEANQKYEDQLANWFKSLLGISSATLAILVSLMPEQAVVGVAKYSLITCWISLAITIFFTLISSYRSVNNAKMELAAQSNSLFHNDQEVLKKCRKMISGGKRISALIKASQVLAASGFALSFVSLAVFACAQTI